MVSRSTRNRTGRRDVGCSAAALWVMRVVAAAAILASPSFAQDEDPFSGKYDPEKAAALLGSGKYAEAVELASGAVRAGWTGRDWQRVLVDGLLATGRYEEAGNAAVSLVNEYSDDLSVLVYVKEVLRRTGRSDDAKRVLEFINRLATVVGEGKDDFGAEALVALGKAALDLGAEPKLVMREFFETARRKSPTLHEAHIAAAELALDKYDKPFAAEILEEAVQAAGTNADIEHLLARAYLDGDREAGEMHLRGALERNPLHFPSILLVAEDRIDAEAWDEAVAEIDKVLASDPNRSEALALKAAVAHIMGEGESFERLREKALEFDPANPEVDHVIGVKVSRQRRFAEGAAFQRRALEIDPGHLGAKLALALDCLRLGDEETAWTLAEEVHRQDGYNVLAFNLVSLRDHLSGFVTLERPGFVVKMVAKEADIYGERVLALLEEAHRVLCGKYGLALDEPVLVEFFPQQQDFAVRTFGVPGGAGILGACFGSVVTMNSPGGLGAGVSNWESTLWHEFCHVVTLTVTRNRMPRWFSEGISVHEERERDPRWGMRMTPGFRRLILDGESMMPLADLSEAFINPRDADHLLFGYFASSLAIEFLLQDFGIEAFRQVLADLAADRSLEESMAARFAPWDDLESRFAAFARAQAEAYGDGLEWDAPDEATLADPAALAAWTEERGNNFHALKRRAAQLIASGDAEAAIAPARRLLEAVPGDTSSDSAYVLLARAYRELGRAGDEKAVLVELARRSGEAPYAYERLMEIHREAGEWEDAEAVARLQLAVNPMTREPHRCIGEAAQATDRHDAAVEAFSDLLRLEPVDAPAVRFQLARSQDALGRSDDARESVLLALEEAPRFREAHRLLLRLSRREAPAPDVPPAEPAPADAPNGDLGPGPSQEN